MVNVFHWFMENVMSNIVGEFIFLVIGIVVANLKRIQLYIKSLIYFRQDVRFSMAYLYQIKIDDRYLLIKGRRIDQYQPVGGVYKAYDSFKQNENSFGIKYESGNNFYEENDLRFYVKGKNISKVLKWFDQGRNREISASREFYEELVATDILPNEAMKSLQIEFVNRIKPKMRYSIHFKTQEILVFDIYSITLEDKFKEIIKVKAETDGTIILASRDEIERECLDINGKSCKIGAHSKYII